MLAQLKIDDIVLIDRLDLRFGPGMSVLTGETGAGKSILLDALMLALGGRGDGGLVRHGEKNGQVTAVFDPPSEHPAWRIVREAGLEADGDLILRRSQAADGRTRAYLNDQPISAQVLRDVGRTLVEIHGQHDDRALLDPAAHRALLDAFGGLETQVRMVRERYVLHRRAIAASEAQDREVARANAEADYLRHSRDELTKLAAEPGEEASLAARRTSMMQAAKVAEDLRDAYDSVAGDGSPTSTLAAVMRRLERRAAQASELIEPSIKALDAVLVALDAAQTTLDQALRDAQHDPGELERIEERLFALRAAGRKYQVPPDTLAELAARFETQLEAIDAGEALALTLRAEVEASARAYAEAAQNLSAERHRIGATLTSAVEAELPPLKLERARFVVRIDTDAEAGGADGFDHVEFWVATNPGSRPGPLTKVASGGELARFMLALKVVLAERGSAPTLVFDEIDTGVGGAVADAIGQRLARLAERVQVLTVTHAPQVAARSTRHLRIMKSHAGESERVATRVTPLDDDARQEEIARMLAGATITQEARAAARRLIETGMEARRSS